MKHINIDQSEQYDIWMAQYTVVYGTATMGTAIKTLEYYILQLLWNRNLRDNMMVAVELCPGKKKFVSATSGKKLFAFDQGEKK